MKIIATICSRTKDTREEPLPAIERYQGEHIQQVADIAQEAQTPFFILSGVYGLVSASEAVPFYDHLLEEDEVPALTKKIVDQIDAHGITEITFYTKEKDAWAPYKAALENASKETGVLFTTKSL
jgi:hypothetical protein